MKKYSLKKHWYLGFIGLVGFYKAPEVWSVFVDGAPLWGLLNLLWLLWFDYFVLLEHKSIDVRKESGDQID